MRRGGGWSGGCWGAPVGLSGGAALVFTGEAPTGYRPDSERLGALAGVLGAVSGPAAGGRVAGLGPNILWVWPG